MTATLSPGASRFVAAPAGALRRGVRPVAQIDEWATSRLLIAFAILGIGLPLIVASQARATMSFAYVLTWVVTLHAAAGLARVFAGPGIRLLHLGFWGYCYCFLGLAAIAQVGSGTYPTGISYSPHITTLSVLMAELGQAAFTAGSLAAPWLGGRRPADGGQAGSAAAPPARSVRLLSPTRIVVMTGVLAAASYYIVTRILPAHGGISVLFTSRQATHQVVSQDGNSADSYIALVTWGVSVPAMWAMIALLRCERLVRPTARPRRWIRSRPWWAWALIAFTVLLNLGLNNPISRPRFWAGTVLCALIFTGPRLRRAGAFRVGAAGFLLMLIVVFPYADYFRYTHNSVVQTTSVGQQFEQKLDYDSLSQMQVGIDYVHRTGFQPQNAAGAALFWVPRAAWPGKPGDTAITLSNWVGYTLTNRSAPLWIESYIWGGYPTIAVLFFVLGAAWRRFDDAYDRGRRRLQQGLTMFLVPTIAFFQIIVLRGSLLQAAAPLAMILVVPLFISTRRRVAARKQVFA